MTGEWRSAAGWAAEAKALGVDPKAVMPHSERNVRDKADRESWSFRERTKGGGGREYPLSALPAVFQKALARKTLKAASAELHGQLALPLLEAADLKTYQRSPMEARAALLGHIDHVMITQGISQGKAIEALIDLADKRELPPELQRAVAVANTRTNTGRTLSRATVYGWLKARGEAAGNVVALAPKAAPEVERPAYAWTLIKLWCRPTKPNITEILEGWPEGEEKPSYFQARRYLKKLDEITKNRGRMGPRLLKSLQAYVARDTSELWPGAIFIGDGHTFKREVAHPIHGRPFRPEVTSFLDVYTRRWVGWSAALAENTWSVADALRSAVTATTCCDIVYYDNGAGAKNKTWDDDVTGLIARLSITKLHSAPWSSQARGIIERFHSSVLHKVARQAVTYVGQRMDPEARQKAFQATRKQIALTGSSPLLTPWQAFIAEIDAAMVEYNDRPHDGLPKSIDPETGKRRHLTPNEMWEMAVMEGWQPDPITTAEAVDLFRPAVTRKVNRGLVQLFDNTYYHDALRALHGERVVVGFDLHDATKVWVRLKDGRFVCEAIWDGHKRAYLPVSVATQALEKRVAGKVARLDKHRDTAMAELPGAAGRVVDATPLTEDQARQLEAMEAEWEEIPPLAEVSALLAAPMREDLHEELMQQLEAEWASAPESSGQPLPGLPEPVAAPDPAAKVISLPVTHADVKKERFARALDIRRRMEVLEVVANDEALWFARYSISPEYRSCSALYDDFGDDWLTG
jgi:putative transposase